MKGIFSEYFLSRLKDNSQFIAEKLLPQARDHGIICPSCDNGTGRDSSGLKEYREVFKCFRCGDSFNIFQLIQKHFRCDFYEAVERAASACSLPLEFEQNHKKKNFYVKHDNFKTNFLPKIPAQKSYYHVDLSDYYNLCHQFLFHFDSLYGDFIDNFDLNFAEHISKLVDQAKDYVKSRALFDHQLADKFNIGFDPFKNCLVIAHNQFYATRRSIGSSKLRFCHNLKNAQVSPFNLVSLNQTEPVFIVEGALDALSLELIGFHALALAGANQKSSFQAVIDHFNNSQFKPSLILLFDNDDAGSKASNSFFSLCRDNNIHAIQLFLEPGCDSNSLLQSDKDKLIQFAQSAVDDIAAQRPAFDNQLKIIQDAKKNAQTYVAPELKIPENIKLLELNAQIDELKKFAPPEFTDELAEKFMQSTWTDLECAILFAKCFHDYRFNASTQRWNFYNGQKWIELPDDRPVRQKWNSIAQIINAKCQIPKCILDYNSKHSLARYSKNEIKEVETLAAYGRKMLSNFHKHNFVESLSELRDIYLEDENFNSDPYLLNLQNCTIHLKNHTLTDHSREDYCSQVAGAEINFDDFRTLSGNFKRIQMPFWLVSDDDKFKNIKFNSPAHRCVEWENFLNEALPNRDLQFTLQTYMGYCLLGEATEDVFMFLYGAGGTGKSTFVETMKNIFGDYAKSFPIEYLTEYGKDVTGDEPSPTLYGMRHARLAISSETKKGRRFDVDKVKRWTGKDTITCRTLYRPSIEFRPKFKILISGNFAPRLEDVNDSGLRRRLRIIPFSKVPKKVNTRLLDIFNQPENKKAILFWVLQGAFNFLNLKHHGFNVFAENNLCSIMKDELKKFYEENDTVLNFVSDEGYERVEGKYITVKKLWADYVEWCRTNHERGIRRSEFVTSILTITHHGDGKAEVEFRRSSDICKTQHFINLSRFSE